MTDRERELLQYADPQEISMTALSAPGYWMSSAFREALEYREANYYRNICYTVAFAMRNV